MALPRPVPTTATKQQMIAEIALVDSLLAAEKVKVTSLTAQLATANAALAPLQAQVADLTNDIVALETINAEQAFQLEIAQAQVADLAEYDAAFSGLLGILAGRGLIVELEEEEV